MTAGAGPGAGSGPFPHVLGPGKRVVLFDFDGTLLDTTPLVRASTHHALGAVLGQDVSEEALTPFLGQTLVRQFQGLVPGADAALVDALIGAYRAHNEEAHDRSVAATPGAVETVRELRRRGFGLAVVSSKRRVMVERGLRWLGLEDAFTVVVALEDTPVHKPDPAPLLLALRAFSGTAPGEAVMVGDSPFDMEAARRARIDGVGVLGNTFSQEDLARAGAGAVLGSLWELPALIGPGRSPGEALT